jgi:hypothetical protein
MLLFFLWMGGGWEFILILLARIVQRIKGDAGPPTEKMRIKRRRRG